MERWTHREYRTRLAWLDEQWNQPSRSDQYRMQIAAEVRRVLSKNPNAINLDDFRLKFGLVRKKPAPKLTKMQKAKQSLAQWVAAVSPKKKSGVTREPRNQ